ncbi:TonB-dependent receptor plug domain-containing protein [Acetobacter sp.]|uniref:TonB-dependent receptor plug domain-containing protein n=1 Tax=Acetobacter sp. TaxID=440 RepID=UPI0039E97FBB
MVGSHHAYAQSLDYSSFEQMFGEPVTTSATGKPQRASELSTDTQIVTAEQIESSGAQTIPEVLRMVPGLDVRRYSLLQANVSVRGNDAAGGARTLVLIDGRQVYLDGYNYTDWATLPVSLKDIRQIEVIRGPNSALYGFNASGGVINIVTRDPLHENKSYIHIGGGSLEGFGGEFVASHKFSDVIAAKLSVNGYRSNEYAARGRYDTYQQTSTINAALELRGQITPQIEWSLTGTIDQAHAPFWLDFGTYFQNTPLSKSLEGKLSADTRWGLIEFKAYHNDFESGVDKNITALGEVLPIDFNYNMGMTNAQLSDTITLNSKNDLRLGVEYRYTDLTAKQENIHLPPENETLGAGSASWDYHILPNLTLTNAVRLDALYVPSFASNIPNLPRSKSRHFVEPSFNSRIRYDAGNAGVFGLNVARGIQLPGLFDFAPTTVFGPVSTLNNALIVPSTTINVGLNYSRHIGPIGANLYVALFAQRTSNMLGTPFASNYMFMPPASVAMFPRNYGRVDDAGGEIRLDGKTGFGLNWDIAYAMAAVRDNNQSSQVNFERQTPVNSVIGGFAYKLGQVELSSHARWQSHYQDAEANFTTLTMTNVKIKDFVTLTARVGWRFHKHFLLSLTGEQLGTSALRETAGLHVQRRLIGGFTASF